MKNKQQKIEKLVDELLDELHNQPYGKIKNLLDFIDKWAIYNSVTITNEKLYLLSDVVNFSNSSNSN